MKKIKILIFGLFVIYSIKVWAEDNNINDGFPKSKPIVKVFANYHFGLNEYSESNAFDITRAYLGYDIKMSEKYSFTTNLDIGNPDNGSNYSYTAYLKTAELKYHNDKLTIHAGLIGLKQFKEQEKNWGYRYIYKSFQDKYKFGTSADQGIMLEYEINDHLLVDATVRNGEGYKSKQTDNTYNGALGLTFKFGTGFKARGYYEYASKAESQSVISGFLGYTNDELLNFGVEYNYMQNHSFIKDENLKGLSVYATYFINDKYAAFGRYDKLSSNTLKGDQDAWNINNNGAAYIAGLQYKILDNIKIAANIQMWAPDKTDLENEMYMYINLEYKF